MIGAEDSTWMMLAPASCMGRNHDRADLSTWRLTARLNQSPKDWPSPTAS